MAKKQIIIILKTKIMHLPLHIKNNALPLHRKLLAG
jgi:hypothetical protein